MMGELEKYSKAHRELITSLSEWVRSYTPQQKQLLRNGTFLDMIMYGLDLASYFKKGTGRLDILYHDNDEAFRTPRVQC